MKARFTCLASILVLIGISFAKYSGGTGEPNDPYLIATPNDLNAIANHPEDMNKCFLQVADINLAGYTGTSFNIIGVWFGWNLPSNIAFEGVFDGNNCKVMGFTFDDRERYAVGLFGYTGENSEIRSVYLEDVNVVGDRYVGGLVGMNYGKILQCSATGSVAGTENVGGLVGMNEYDGVIANCHSDVVMRNYGHQFAIGCLVGYNYEGDISDSCSAGIIDGNESTTMAGGLVGFNRGRISSCCSTADVSGYASIGGLVGDQDAYDLLSCYATGHISSESDGGGLVGRNYYGAIVNCYASGDVHCTSGAGGLVGYNFGCVINCYSTGKVTGTTNVGGLVGGKNLAAYYSDCFWDVNTSSQNISAGGTGKTTEQMQKAAMYSRWGYCEIWKIDDSNDYPRLLWQSGPGEPIVHPDQLFAGGSGSAEDPYLIETSEQLVNISLTYCAWDKYFKLIADIDMNDFNCAEMGMIGVASFAFRGVFDGNRNTISNLHICSDAYAKVGLFGQLEGYDSAVVNLGLISPNIDTNTSREVGSLAGKLNRATTSGCYCRGGNVSGYGRVGGLVGYNFLGTVLDSYAQTNVSASGGFDTGGLVGRLNSGNMTRTYSTGSVSAGGSPGGLLGKNFYGRVYDSFWDTQTSDCNVSDGGTGLTTVEMQTENTFTDAGWDFIGEETNGYDNIWRMCQDEVDYPKLTWEFTSYGDLTCPDGVDFNDYSILADQWLLEKLDADMTNDGRVNLRDFAAWANQWQGDYSLLKELTQSWLAHSAGIADIAPTGGDDFVDWQDLAILTWNWLGEK